MYCEGTCPESNGDLLYNRKIMKLTCDANCLIIASKREGPTIDAVPLLTVWSLVSFCPLTARVLLPTTAHVLSSSLQVVSLQSLLHSLVTSFDSLLIGAIIYYYYYYFNYLIRIKLIGFKVEYEIIFEVHPININSGTNHHVNIILQNKNVCIETNYSINIIHYDYWVS